MRKLYLFLIMLLACAQPAKPAEAPAAEPIMVPTKPPEVTFHADIGFTDHERNQLDLAAELWSVQTSGLAKIELVYDLVPENFGNLIFHSAAGHNTVYRKLHSDPNIAEEDCKIAKKLKVPCGLWPDGPKLLGDVSPPGGIHNPWKLPLTMRFVVDSCGESLRQVALHEFGHALGLPHHPSLSAIMTEWHVPRDPECLRQPDLMSFCSINVCGAHKMRPCE